MVCGFPPRFTWPRDVAGKKKQTHVLQFPEFSLFQDLDVNGDAEYMHRGIAGYVLQTVVQVSWRCKISVA